MFTLNHKTSYIIMSRLFREITAEIVITNVSLYQTIPSKSRTDYDCRSSRNVEINQVGDC